MLKEFYQPIISNYSPISSKGGRSRRRRKNKRTIKETKQ
jgi:hypothetical protein